MWAVLGCVTLVGAAIAYSVTQREPTTVFCTTGLAYRSVTVEGESRIAAYEDQGSPGDDGCDISEPPSETGDFSMILGYDCNVRDSSDAVVGEAPANRSDDTCGQVPL
jgi:hypothetical protein